MADVPVQLIVAAFQDENGADAALAELKQAKKEKLVNIKDAAVVRKDAKGELHLKDVNDMTGTRGGVVGGVVGAGLAVLTGGASLALIGLGAATGGIAAKLRDTGFKDDRLRQLGNSLTPGSSAIVAVIEHTWVSEAEQEFKKAGGEVVISAVASDIAAQLDAGNDVGYTVIRDSDAIAAARVVTGPAAGGAAADAPAAAEGAPAAPATDAPPAAGSPPSSAT